MAKMDGEGTMGNLQVLLTIMSKYHLSFFVEVSQRYYTCQLGLLILLLHLSTSQQKCEEASKTSLVLLNDVHWQEAFIDKTQGFYDYPSQ